MSTAPGPLPLTLEEKLQAPRCALLVIDMQNDFCAPGGYIDTVMGKSVETAGTVVEPVGRLVDAARAAGVPVVWVRADYSRDRIPASMQVKLVARGIEAVCCAPGTWGADWFGPRPADGEPIVTKHTYSGFHDTPLADRLQALGVQTLVFAGVQTQVCVESTVRDGHSRGYFCVVAQDAVASHTASLHQATLDNVRFLFGDVCPSTAVFAAWSAPPPPAAGARSSS